MYTFRFTESAFDFYIILNEKLVTPAPYWIDKTSVDYRDGVNRTADLGALLVLAGGAAGTLPFDLSRPCDLHMTQRKHTLHTEADG